MYCWFQSLEALKKGAFHPWQICVLLRSTWLWHFQCSAVNSQTDPLGFEGHCLQRRACLPYASTLLQHHRVHPCHENALRSSRWPAWIPMYREHYSLGSSLIDYDTELLGHHSGRAECRLYGLVFSGNHLRLASCVPTLLFGHALGTSKMWHSTGSLWLSKQLQFVSLPAAYYHHFIITKWKAWISVFSLQA